MNGKILDLTVSELGVIDVELNRRVLAKMKEQRECYGATVSYGQAIKLCECEDREFFKARERLVRSAQAKQAGVEYFEFGTDGMLHAAFALSERPAVLEIVESLAAAKVERSGGRVSMRDALAQVVSERPAIGRQFRRALGD